MLLGLEKYWSKEYELEIEFNRFAIISICIIAVGSKDPVWLKALEFGEDLHSICADLVYGDDWANKAEEGCKFVESKQKCDCKEHKRLRTNVKTINFGLAYGMGPQKLSDTLQISTEEAESLNFSISSLI